MRRPVSPSSPLVPAILVALSLLAGAAAAAPSTNNPAHTDPGRTDADFPFQGEYAGTIIRDGRKAPFGVQVIAQGDGMFDVVAYPGGLPGDGWTPPNKTSAKGTRTGTGADAVVKVDAVEFDGTRRRGEIRGDALAVLSDDGSEVARFSRVERKSPTLGQKPPPGAILLFDGIAPGGDLSRFAEGRLSPDGLLMEGATTKDSFGDATWHVEFRLPYQPKDREQHRGNSGVYLQGGYEVQVLDSFGLEGKNNECGGVYSVAAPRVNMCLPPLVWQTYDVDFTAARFEGDRQVSPPRMTVRHNGVVIHDQVEVPKVTPAGRPSTTPGRGPLYLQDHGNPVRYRNIWVLPKT